MFTLILGIAIGAAVTAYIAEDSNNDNDNGSGGCC